MGREHHTKTFLTCDCEAVPVKKTFAQKVLEHSWHSSYLHSQWSIFDPQRSFNSCIKCLH